MLESKSCCIVHDVSASALVFLEWHLHKWQTTCRWIRLQSGRLGVMIWLSRHILSLLASGLFISGQLPVPEVSMPRGINMSMYLYEFWLEWPMLQDFASCHLYLWRRQKNGDRPDISFWRGNKTTYTFIACSFVFLWTQSDLRGLS